MFQDLKDILVHISLTELKQAITIIRQEIALKERQQALLEVLRLKK